MTIKLKDNVQLEYDTDLMILTIHDKNDKREIFQLNHTVANIILRCFI